MQSSMHAKLEILEKRYKELHNLLINNKNNFFQKKNILFKEYANLNKIISIFKEWRIIKNNIQSVEILLKDPEIRELALEELQIIKKQRTQIEYQLKVLLIPQDVDDVKNCFLEIRAATGGEEAAIFAGDLFRMYYRYTEIKKWNIEIININESEYGGYKEIIVKISGKNVYSRLKFESGGHRVQRIPTTESQGRVHTSTCTVAILPEVPITEFQKINNNQLRIDTFRSSGAGGQHVNTTDSAIRITHIPTGIVVECQDERSQYKNKSKALSVLAARIRAAEIHQQHELETSKRRNLLGSGDRSDRIRTYNFPQGRITDHRINLTCYKLNEIINGKLDIIIQPIIDEYQSDLI